MNEEIVPGLSIICEDGLVFGSVEAVEPPYLLTTPMHDGQRHYLPLGTVERVEDAVYLALSHDELLQLL